VSASRSHLCLVVPSQAGVGFVKAFDVMNELDVSSNEFAPGCHILVGVFACLLHPRESRWRRLAVISDVSSRANSSAEPMSRARSAAAMPG
jgi:hypothetical protein